MTREELDKKIIAINKEQIELENKISELKRIKDELQRLYVSEYPNKVKEGSKIRIKDISGKEYIVFIGCHKFKDSSIASYNYSCLYKDKSIGVKLLKVKKDGTPSERVERVWDDIVEVEILE